MLHILLFLSLFVCIARNMNYCGKKSHGILKKHVPVIKGEKNVLSYTLFCLYFPKIQIFATHNSACDLHPKMKVPPIDRESCRDVKTCECPRDAEID